jgi:hypothetical protein
MMMTQNPRFGLRSSLTALGALMLSACGGDSVDLGDTDPFNSKRRWPSDTGHRKRHDECK